MEENSLHFWIIPIVCMVIVFAIFAFALDYKINTIFPNAEREREEIKRMSCPEILQKDASDKYWSSENRELGETRAASCSVPQESQSSSQSPYVEFCTPGGFAPVKKIENSTHIFNHDTCVWDLK